MSQVLVRCGEFRCIRWATQVPTGWSPTYKGKEDQEYQAAREVKCNHHVGVDKRRQYGRVKDWEPLSGRQDIVALALAFKQRQDAENRKRRDEEHAKAAARDAKLLRQAWALVDDAIWLVADDPDEWTLRRDVMNASVTLKGGHWGDKWSISTEVAENYGTTSDDFPLMVRLNRAGSLTPDAARALADALNIMAIRVERANSLLQRPEPVEEEVTA